MTEEKPPDPQQPAQEIVLSVPRRVHSLTQILSFAEPRAMAMVNGRRMKSLVLALAQLEIGVVALSGAWKQYCDTPDDETAKANLAQVIQAVGTLACHSLGIKIQGAPDSNGASDQQRRIQLP